ncbi:unnamed protein product [Rotaria sordida]|uniref:Uncharacterized protein n=1 Tax=Rotaria sordida TaxID=392033 RepID=A0A815N5U9_9BILA|nr:unnamed protein product [Rotaria sordida]CAF1184302.1 unnamed protein product [Rotaria sordida]CAF1432162.1 unnamed protein product [Rotaria sordida]CAF1447183.1 unnamed protein product [Rotaria sordida]
MTTFSANIEEFTLLELFLQCLTSNSKLHYLYLNNRAYYIDDDKHFFIDGNRWQPIVLNLDEFHSSLRVRVLDFSGNEEQLTSLRTPFWLDEKKIYFKLDHRCESDFDYDIYYLHTIPYRFSHLHIHSFDRIITTTTNELINSLPYRYVTSLDCTRATLQVYLNFMLEYRLNIKELNIYINVWDVNQLTSKEINEIQDVCQESLDKIQYLKLMTAQNIVVPYTSPLKTPIAQILNSFTNLHCLTIKYKSRHESVDVATCVFNFNPEEFQKDEQLENDVKQWLVDNTCLKDKNKFYTDYNEDDGLRIFI